MNGKIRKIAHCCVFHQIFNHLAVLGLMPLLKARLLPFQFASIPKKGQTAGTLLSDSTTNNITWYLGSTTYTPHSACDTVSYYNVPRSGTSTIHLEDLHPYIKATLVVRYPSLNNAYVVNSNHKTYFSVGNATYYLLGSSTSFMSLEDKIGNQFQAFNSFLVAGHTVSDLTFDASMASSFIVTGAFYGSGSTVINSYTGSDFASNCGGYQIADPAFTLTVTAMTEYQTITKTYNVKVTWDNTGVVTGVSTDSGHVF